jgi:lipopolysaccharide transport system ATP-binding protein
MSNDIVIKVENLWKQYRYGVLSHKVLYKDLQSWWARFRGKEDPNLRIGANLSPLTFNVSQSEDRFWALRDVSFDVKQGEVLGIIGRNGAGKSTLLKIMSKVTTPTKGQIKIKGRVASLLEVGTGFHPELTGRENIFLNGAILGMTTDEIRRKFDEIVAFAEVEKFIDTPVKRYSSGMYVRLAFAVAAHLEPEILIVDEVLAVGDAFFQKKCLGKMGDVAKEGRTVLFVSHNMNAIEQLCTSALLIVDGRVNTYCNDVRSTVKKYLSDRRDVDENSASWVNTGELFETQWFKPVKLYIGDRNGNALKMPVSNDSEIWVHVEGEVKHADPALQIGYALYSQEGTLLYWTCHTDEKEKKWPKVNEGLLVLRSQIPKRLINEGTYRLDLIVALYFRVWLCEPDKKTPTVYLTIQGGLSDSPYWMIRRPGILAPVLLWERK